MIFHRVAGHGWTSVESGGGYALRDSISAQERLLHLGMLELIDEAQEAAYKKAGAGKARYRAGGR